MTDRHQNQKELTNAEATLLVAVGAWWPKPLTGVVAAATAFAVDTLP